MQRIITRYTTKHTRAAGFVVDVVMVDAVGACLRLLRMVCDLEQGQLRRFFVGVVFLPDARRILFLVRTLPRRDMLNELQWVFASTKVHFQYHATEHEGDDTRIVQHPMRSSRCPLSLLGGTKIRHPTLNTCC